VRLELKKSLFRQTRINKRLVAGIFGAGLIHAALWWSGFSFVKPPQFAVVVSPSVLEVALVKPAPQKKKLPEPEPPVTFEPLPVVEPTEPLPVKEPEVDPGHVEEIEQTKDKEEERVEEINIVQGAQREAVALEHINKPPRFPRRARQRGWEGTVILVVRVREEGTVSEVQIKRSSGYGILDEAAADAVRFWRFEPAVRFGRPVRSNLEVPILFRLTDEG